MALNTESTETKMSFTFERLNPRRNTSSESIVCEGRDNSCLLHNKACKEGRKTYSIHQIE